MRGVIAIVATCVLVGGCLRSTSHTCASDGDCGAGGACEADGFCSVADPSCISGRSYDEHAGALAGSCTRPGLDAGVDAAPDAGPDGGGRQGRFPSPCLEGPPLAAGDACVAAVCAPPFEACCDTWWSDVCVQRAQTECDSACAPLVVLADEVVGADEVPIAAYLLSAPTTPIWQGALAGRQECMSLSWLDLDGDGAAELFIGGVETDGQHAATSQVLPNQGLSGGALGFGDPIYQASDGYSTFDATWVDLDGDGRAELSLAGFEGLRRTTWVDDALVTVIDPPCRDHGCDQLGWATAIAAGNLDGVDGDGDRDLDLAIGRYELQVEDVMVGIVTVLGNRDGELTPVWTDTSAELRGVLAVAWVDVDGDGYPELAVSGNRYVAVYRNRGGVLEDDPSFFVATDGQVVKLRAGDLDGDDDLDLVAIGRNTGTRVFRNQSGALDPAPAWTGDPGEYADGLLVDGDGDHDLDLLVADRGGAGLILRNTSTTTSIRFERTGAVTVGAGPSRAAALTFLP